MAFFYEADAPVWKYKQRYNYSWEPFPKKVGQKLEKLYKKTTQDQDTSNVKYKCEIKGSTWTVDVQSMTAADSGSYNRSHEVSRESYPYPKEGSKDKLKSLFKKYRDPEDEECFSQEGLQDFFKQAKIDPNKVDSLICLGLMELKSVFEIERDFFINGLAKCGCDSLDSIRSRVKEITPQIYARKKVLRMFVRWLHKASKEDNQKAIPMAVAVHYLKIILHDENRSPVRAKMVEYLESDNVKNKMGDTPGLHCDDFEMIFEFLGEIKNLDDFDTEDEDTFWPTLLLDFGEWAKKGATSNDQKAS